jgi:hypothetical protein
LGVVYHTCLFNIFCRNSKTIPWHTKDYQDSCSTNQQKKFGQLSLEADPLSVSIMAFSQALLLGVSLFK